MSQCHDTQAVRGADPERPRKVNLFETARCFADVHVLAPLQGAKLHAHATEDKAYHVLSGTGLVTVGSEVYRVRSGHLVFCPAGVPHGVRNDGEEDLRLLVFMAPHPRPPAQKTVQSE